MIRYRWQKSSVTPAHLRSAALFRCPETPGRVDVPEGIRARAFPMAPCGKRGKRNKVLWEAYNTADEGHDLVHFTTVLANHEAAMQLDLERLSHAV